MPWVVVATRLLRPNPIPAKRLPYIYKTSKLETPTFGASLSFPFRSSYPSETKSVKMEEAVKAQGDLVRKLKSEKASK